MSIIIDLDPVIVEEQIQLLRGSMGNRGLTPRHRFLLTNLLQLLQTLKRHADEPCPPPAAARPQRPHA